MFLFNSKASSFFFTFLIPCKSLSNTDVLASLSTDYSSLSFSYFKNEESNRDRCFWKFNNSLIENKGYVQQMKKLISDTLNEKT